MFKKPQLTDAEYETVATNYIGNSLSDPIKPKACALCVLGCLAAIFNGMGESDHHELTARSLAKRQRLCEILLHFLIRPRTPKSIPLLLKNFMSVGRSECLHCTTLTFGGRLRPEGFLNSGTRIWDRHGVIHGTPAHLLVFQIFERMTAVLKDTSRPSSLPRVVKGTQTRHWPTQISQVLVNGPDSFVTAITQWQDHLPLPIPLGFLASAIQTCGRQLTLAVLASNRFRPSFASRLRKVNAAIAEKRMETLGMNPHFFSASFLRQLIKDSPSQDSIRFWMHGGEMEMLTVISETITLAETAVWRENHPKINEWIQDTFAMFGSRFNDLVSEEQRATLHPSLQGPSTERTPTVDSVRGDLWKVRREGECATSGCSKTSQEIGKPFQRCGRCGVVSYCGPKCQKTDWKEGPHPHKDLCPLICNFLDGGGGLGNISERQKFYELISQSDVEDATWMRLHAWIVDREERKQEFDEYFWRKLRPSGGGSSDSRSGSAP